MQYARVATRLTLCACSMSAWHLSQLASEDAPLRLPQSPRRPLPPTLPLTSAEVASALRAALLTAGGSGPDVHGQVCTAPAELEGYAASQYSYHAGPAPDVIVFPRNTAEVAAVVRACAEQRFNLVPRAGGTSLEGQVVPVAAPPATLGRGRATIVLDMQRMDRVLEVNPRDMDIRVQAGVGWVGLANVLKPLGLMFPVDPGPGAQIGGMCGTGCSGTHAVRHGAMKANVLSLTAVAADGSVFRTGTRARKSVAGLDLTSLLIGSEGTLAIVTEAVLRVVPLPEVTVVVCTPFATVRSACQAVNDAALAGLPLAAAELLDARMAGVVGSQSGGALLPAGAVPHVLWKLAGAPGAVAEAAGRLRAVALAAGATDWQCSSSAETAEALWEARKAALFSVQASSPECSVLTTDVCVPTSELPALLENFEAHYALQAGAAARGALPAAFAVAHAGDGNAHHFLSFAPGTPQEAAAKGLADWLALEAIRLQGTCTGEHGVGSGKRKYLLRELGEGNARVAGLIKAALDPLGILNPGKKHA